MLYVNLCGFYADFRWVCVVLAIWVVKSFSYWISVQRSESAADVAVWRPEPEHTLCGGFLEFLIPAAKIFKILNMLYIFNALNNI